MSIIRNIHYTMELLACRENIAMGMLFLSIADYSVKMKPYNIVHQPQLEWELLKTYLEFS